MTTPERLRRRQRIETALVTVTMVLSAASMYVLSLQNEEQDRCQAEAFGDLSAVLERRSDLAAQERDAIGDVLTAADADRTQGSAMLEAELAEYVATRARVKAALKKSEIPPFPTGKCD